MGRPKINIPKQETYGEATAGGLEAQIKLAPELMAAEREYAPQKQQLDIDLLRSALFGSDGQPGLIDMYGGPGAAARAQEVGMGGYSREQAGADKAAQVESEMALVRKYGPEAREAFEETNPLLNALEREAMQGIERGGEVSDEMRREISQPILAQYSRMGRTFDPVAAGALMRGTESARQKRIDRARGFGTQIAGMKQRYDPFHAILGRPGQGGQLYGQQMGLAQGVAPGQVFNPEAGASYTQQAYANLVGLKGAEASAQAQWAAGLFSGIGSAAGGLCHVAREVYGETNPRWLQFFFWKEMDGPKWFRNFYNRHSERIAGFIRNKPWLKNLIRHWMDKRIA